MNTMSTLLITSLLSSVAIATLGWLDPKRNVQARARQHTHYFIRRALCVFMLLPGVWLACTSQGAALVLWIAIISLFGWLVAWVLSRPETPGKRLSSANSVE